MPLSKKDTKFAMRVAVLLITTFSLALAVRIVHESQEMAKLLAPSTTRSILLFVAPAATLAILQYTLAVKSFNTRSFLAECITFLGVICIFAGVVSPAVIGTHVAIPVADCGNWIRKCPDELVWVANQNLSLGLLVSGALLLSMVLWTQLTFRAGSQQSHSVGIDQQTTESNEKTRQVV